MSGMIEALNEGGEDGARRYIVTPFAEGRLGKPFMAILTVAGVSLLITLGYFVLPAWK